MSRVSQARSLGKYFLLVDNMLVVLGFFVVFPLISIRFVDQMGWAAVMVGIALGLRQFVQQGLGVFGGAIADRFGAKPMIVTGMLLRAAGFATMAVAHEPWLLWFSCFLSGIGGTLFAAFQRFEYDFVLAILIAIIAVVLLGEFAANYVKRIFHV